MMCNRDGLKVALRAGGHTGLVFLFPVWVGVVGVWVWWLGVCVLVVAGAGGLCSGGVFEDTKPSQAVQVMLARGCPKAFTLFAIQGHLTPA